MFEVNTTIDGYLLYKGMHKDCIKRIIDVSTFNIPKNGQNHLDFYTKNNPKIFKEEIKNCYLTNDYNILDRYYIQEMTLYLGYDPERDIFAWYDDIRMLSGSKGYIRFRDGYICDNIVVLRS